MSAHPFMWKPESVKERYVRFMATFLPELNSAVKKLCESLDRR